MSRVLLFNQYYPPDTSATALVARDAARALARAGHSVHVIAGRPSYQPEHTLPWRWSTTEMDDGITVQRVGSTAFTRVHMAGRITNYLSYLALALAAGLPRRPDVVIAMTDPPLAAAVGAVVAARGRTAFVYNIRDLHPDVALAAGLVGRGPLIDLWDAVHRWALRRAWRIIVLGDDMRERIVEKGIDPGRIAVVRDGAAAMEVVNGDHPVARYVRQGFRFTVVHGGNLGVAGAWDAVLEAAEHLERDGVGFVFVGTGASAARIRDRAETRPNVRVIDPRPASEIPHVLAAGDLQLVTVRAGLQGLVVPSKLYPILAAGRPVLAVVPSASDVARIVTEHRCGWVVDPSDPPGIAEAIRRAATRPEALATCAEAARAAAPRYARDTWLRRFVVEVETALGS